FNDVRARLAERRIRLELTDDACRYIAASGYDPVYGARPLRRFIAREVETRIGRALLAGQVRDGALVRVDVRGGQLTVEYSGPADWRGRGDRGLAGLRQAQAGAGGCS